MDLRHLNGRSEAVEARQLARRSVTLHPSGQYIRTPPVIIDSPASNRQRIDARLGPQAYPAISLFEIEEAVVFGPGMVWAQSALIEESLINIRRSHTSILGFLRHLPDSGDFEIHSMNESKKEMKSAILLKSAWASNYGHWLTENFARIFAAQDYIRNCGLPIIVPAWPRGMMSVFRDSLSMAGVGEDRIAYSNNSPISVEKLIVISPVSEHPWVHVPESIQFLNALPERDMASLARQCPDTDGGARIYFSRRFAGRRRMVNEEDVIALLESRGFTAFDPEHLTFRDQIEITRRARTIVAATGAALTNLVFSKERPTIIALSGRDFVDDFFWDISSHCGSSYIAIHGNYSESAARNTQADFLISIENLSNILDTYE